MILARFIILALNFIEFELNIRNYYLIRLIKHINNLNTVSFRLQVVKRLRFNRY